MDQLRDVTCLLLQEVHIVSKVLERSGEHLVKLLLPVSNLDVVLLVRQDLRDVLELFDLALVVLGALKIIEKLHAWEFEVVAEHLELLFEDLV